MPTKMASLACATGSQISFSCPTDGAPLRGVHSLMLELNQSGLFS